MNNINDPEYPPDQVDPIEFIVDFLKDMDLADRKAYMHNLVMEVFSEQEWRDMMLVGWPTRKYVTASPLRPKE